MSEPLIVDPDGLDAASKVLGQAAGEIPVEVPKFAVSGTDPLSLAIAIGAIQVEEPMAALPGIKADAAAVAEKIGVASQKYRDTDRMLAETAKHHQFPGKEGGQAGGNSKSVSDELLRNMAEGASAAGSSALPGSLSPDKTGWILGGAGATAQAFTDKIAELTRRGLETGGEGANQTLKKAVGEIKNPFTFLGKEAPAMGSKMGGGVGAVLSIPSIIRDVGGSRVVPTVDVS